MYISNKPTIIRGHVGTQACTAEKENLYPPKSPVAELIPGKTIFYLLHSFLSISVTRPL